MGAMSADGPALLAAAIRSAIQAGAPRRTVQAVAAAVAGVLVRPPAAAAEPHTDAAAPAGPAGPAEGEADPAQLVSRLRAVRRSQRMKKKERVRAAKQAAAEAQSPEPLQPVGPSDSIPEDAAGQCPGAEGAPAAAPARSSSSPVHTVTAQAPPSAQGSEETAQTMRAPSASTSIVGPSASAASAGRERHSGRRRGGRPY